MLMRVKPGWKCVIPVLLMAGGPTAMAQNVVRMEVTAYCDCGECNGYKRGSWKFLKLDQWNKYVDYGTHKGKRYTDETAGPGKKLKEPRAGLFSKESVKNPLSVPGKVIMPWRATQRLGSIAADTAYYPFGTRMYVPGWGWGQVVDVGGAIKGPNRIDIFFNRHGDTKKWGRQHLDITVDSSSAQ